SRRSDIRGLEWSQSKAVSPLSPQRSPTPPAPGCAIGWVHTFQPSPIGALVPRAMARGNKPRVNAAFQKAWMSRGNVLGGASIQAAQSLGALLAPARVT